MPNVVYEFASMCSMSFTVVVSARSNGVMTRPAIWSGGKPVVLKGDADDGNVDAGEDVDRHAQRRERAEEENQQRRNDERVGAGERDPDYGKHAPSQS